MKPPLGRSKSKNAQLDTAKRALFRTLEVAEKALDGFPIPGAKGAIGAVLHIIAEAERTESNAETCAQLKDNIDNLCKQLMLPLKGKDEKDLSPELKEAISDFAQRMDDAKARLKHPKQSEYSKFRRWLYSREIQDDLLLISGIIRDDALAHLVGGLQRLEINQGQQMNAVQHLMMGQASLQDNGKRLERMTAINNLRRAREAKFDSESQPHGEDGKPVTCFQDTRKEIIKMIMNWFKDPESRDIFWLKGGAGTGKTTIARTIAVRLQELKLKDPDYVCATFFFSRVGSGDQRNPFYVFPTLAHQLAFSQDRLRDAIGDAVKESHDIDHAGIIKQFQTLIAKPLTVSNAHDNKQVQILIVLDALDECQGEDDHHPQQILKCLLDFESNPSYRVRFLITGRPELHIRFALENKDQVVIHELDPEDKSAQSDVAHFLRAKIACIPGDLGLSSMSGWPKEADVRSLSAKSGHLFIFATTALRFIGDNRVRNPRRQLDILLGIRTSTINPYSPLDALYLQVLRDGFPRGRMDPEDFASFRRVMGCIVLLQDRLPKSAIAHIAQVEVHDVERILDLLQSVILWTHVTNGQSDDVLNDERLPTIYHPSFSDFIVNSERCDDPHFTINPEETHSFLLLRAFQLMAANLHRNLLQLSNPYTINASISDLAKRMKEKLRPEVVYVCRYWISHLLVTRPNATVLRSLEDFLSHQLLFWCEALSLLNAAHGGRENLGSTVDMLQNAWEWAVRASLHPDIQSLLNDVYRFLLSHHIVMSDSAMHVYYTALPFTPHEVPLYTRYKNEAGTSVHVLQGLDPHWTSCLLSTAGGLHIMSGDVKSLSISLDGTQLAIGLGEGVSLWDARSAAFQYRLPHAKPICRLAFSPTNKVLSAASQDVITLWDTVNGTRTAQISVDDSGGILDITFSPDGQYLIASQGTNIFIYDGDNLQHLSSLPTPHTHLCLVFSWNGQQVITGSKNGDIFFFTPSSWTSSPNLTTNHEKRLRHGQVDVLCLSLNRENQRLASGAVDGTVKIWDLSSSACIATLPSNSGKAINALAYHPHQEQLAVVGEDRSLVLWEPNTAVSQSSLDSEWLSYIVGRHASSINGVGYCAEGARIYTSSVDGTFKQWENNKIQITSQLPSHSDWVCYYTLNSDETLLATGGEDRLVMTWNLRTGEHLKTFRGHEWAVYCLAFSADSKLLASGSGDCTARVWDVETGANVYVFGGHDNYLKSISFSDNRKRLITRTPDVTSVWDLNSGKQVDQFLEGDKTKQNSVMSGTVNNRFQLGVGEGRWLHMWDRCSPSPEVHYICRMPEDYRITGFCVRGDRLICVCASSQVLILDISRIHQENAPSRKG